MKKTFRFFCLAFGICFFVAGEALPQFGFKAGITLANISVDDKIYYNRNIKTKNNIGFNFGIFVNVKGSENFMFKTGLMFNRKEVEVMYLPSIPLFGDDINYRVDYLIYSVTGKYTFLEKENISPYLYASPRLNFYLGDNFNQGITITTQQQDIISEKQTRLGFGLSIGGGMEFARYNKIIPFLEAQFSPDFFDAYDDGIVSSKSNSIEILFGVRFNN